MWFSNLILFPSLFLLHAGTQGKAIYTLKSIRITKLSCTVGPPIREIYVIRIQERKKL